MNLRRDSKNEDLFLKRILQYTPNLDEYNLIVTTFEKSLAKNKYFNIWKVACLYYFMNGKFLKTGDLKSAVSYNELDIVQKFIDAEFLGLTDEKVRQILLYSTRNGKYR